MLVDLDAAKDRAIRRRSKVKRDFTVASMSEAVLDFYAGASFRPARFPLRVPKLLSQRG
jgi:hypothetical protein